MLGYRKGEDGNPQIIPEEAEIIQLIYFSYLDGKSLGSIADLLNEKQIPTPSGKSTWNTDDLDNDDDRGSVPMRQIAALNDEILQLKQILQQADAKQVSNRSDALTQEFIQLVSSTDFNATGYSDTLVIRTIEEITVLSHDKIRIRFMGGYAVEEYIVKI